MFQLAPLALFAWIPLVLCMFAVLPPRRAVITAFVGGWLFLPWFAMDIIGLPPLSKVSAAGYGVLFGAFVFDGGTLLSFRPRWFDLPIATYLISPMMASLTNGLGPYDGASAMLKEVVLWGFPYFLARCYFTDFAAARELAIGVFVGGLLYMPLCWVEMVMSPQIHRWVYGMHVYAFTMAKRSGGYRPSVFMQHGLACAMWMTTASIVGVWLWWSKSLRTVLGFPIGALVVPLVLTAMMCRSAGALVLLVAGLGTFLWVAWFRNALPLLALVAFTPVYVGLRASQAWSGEGLVRASAEVFSEDRAKSLQFRLNAENLLAAKALQQPAFGWGRWGRARVYNDKGKDIAITDGLWVIYIGTTGVVGLTGVILTILLPSILFWWRCPPEFWRHPMAAPGAAFAVLLPLHMLDNLWNAMLNPVYVLVMGATVGLGASVAAAARRAPRYAAPAPAGSGPGVAVAR